MSSKQVDILWYKMDLSEIATKLGSNAETGLGTEEVEKKFKKYGWNVFKEERRSSWLNVLWHQFQSPLIVILIVAGIVTFFLSEYKDMVVIAIVIFVNTIIGLFQEGRASRAFEKLRNSQKRTAVVVRGGVKRVIETRFLVPGDLVILKAGSLVPADGRIIFSKECKVNESVLTGEWVAVDKISESIKEEKRTLERSNMVWMGTIISSGEARMFVTGTGDQTEIGKIAATLQGRRSERTPFQKNINKLARFLGLVIVSASIAVFVIGTLGGQDYREMLLLSIAIAVAAIPEGLAIAVTVVLAIGLEEMLRTGGLVKSLNAAETLGSTSVILTDKTGTLTQAKMQVADIITVGEDVASKQRTLEFGVLASEAFLERRPIDGDISGDWGDWIVHGSSLEKAIYLAALGMGIKKDELLIKSPQIDFLSFKSENRFSASLNKYLGARKRLFILGAPEVIFDNLQYYDRDGERVVMPHEMLLRLKRHYEKESLLGFRFVAVGYKDVAWDSLSDKRPSEISGGLVFSGLVGLHDPIREDVVDSIRVVKEAGIDVIVATGDYAGTARHIAEEVGVVDRDKQYGVLTGEDMDKMKPGELEKALLHVKVFARVLPEQKLLILEALRKRGEVVAMTGDGINDSPALKMADIGIALGSGQDIAKEASGLILLDNSFTVISEAIAIGRRIVDNLKKIVVYLLATGFSEIILVSSAMVLNIFDKTVSVLPILPIQILWANIIGEGLMSFAYAFEPAEKDIMKRSPKTQESKELLTLKTKRLIYTMTIITGVGIFLFYIFLVKMGYPIELVRTLVFAAVSIDTIFFAFSVKDFRRPIWKIDFFSNKYLIAANLFSGFVLFIALFIPSFQKLLSLVPLSPTLILLVLIIGLANLALIELVKYFIFERATGY